MLWLFEIPANISSVKYKKSGSAVSWIIFFYNHILYCCILFYIVSFLPCIYIYKIVFIFFTSYRYFLRFVYLCCMVNMGRCCKVLYTLHRTHAKYQQLGATFSFPHNLVTQLLKLYMFPGKNYILGLMVMFLEYLFKKYNSHVLKKHCLKINRGYF